MEGVISGSLDIEDQLNKVGCFTVTFNCKPYRYKKDGLLETSVTSGSSLFNPEAFSAKPLITLTGSGDFTLTLQNGGYNRSWQFKGIKSGITCDSEQMNFYFGTQLLNDKVTGEDFSAAPARRNRPNGIRGCGDCRSAKVVLLMIPVLYPANSTSFTTFGLGTLTDTISCEVTEERNGVFECILKYPITGQHYKLIAKERLIKAKPNDTENRRHSVFIG